jgi:hypothetical protein
MKCTLTRTAKGAKKAAALKSGAAVASFSLLDDQDDVCTVQGVDAAGASVDISAVATIAVTSDTPAVLSVDAPVGMSFTMSGLLPGSANVTVIATWNDASVGPFQIVLPVTCTGGPATGIVVTPGTPTVRP